MTEEEFQERQAKKEEKKEQNKRNAANNAQALRVAAKVAENTPEATIATAGKIVSTADKLTGGKSTELLGHAMNLATPKPIQGVINKTAESGALNAADKIASTHNNKTPQTTDNKPNEQKNQKKTSKNEIPSPTPSNNTKNNNNNNTNNETKKNPSVLLIILIIIFFPILLTIIIAFMIGPLLSLSSSSNGFAYGTTCKGITVTGPGAGTYPLDDYIAGVIDAEAYSNGGEEALKAQAIAARTYALYRTKNCTKSINNSTYAQKFDPNYGEWAKTIAYDTAGLVLTYNGEIFSSQYDSYCRNDPECRDSTCNSTGCTVEYTKLPNNEKHTITLSTEYWRGKIRDGEGHARGMSQLVSYEMAAKGATYEEILKYFYSDGVEISSMASGSGEGLQEIDGFMARTSRATRENTYFYGDGAFNEGECAWYAVRRTNEILGNLGKEKRVSNGGNGGDFCTANDYDSFPKSYDINDVKPGDVISWKYGSSYGHVAVIEKVYRDSSGKPTKVLISEAYNSLGSGYNTRYKASNGKTYLINNDSGVSIRDTPYTSLRQELRKYNCEGPSGFGTGCQQFIELSIKELKNHGWNGYKFVCYIHLVN